MPSRTCSAFYAVWAAALVGTTVLVNRIVTEPFLDETIHVRQAQSMCRGDLRHWDDRITTPPGLYLVSFIASRVVPLLCRPPTIRWVNTLATLPLPWLYSHLFASRGTTVAEASSHSSLQAIALASFPLPLFFSFLYYTEAFSLLCVLSSLLLALRSSYISSALVGFVSLWFRQTNIIWIAFIAGAAVHRHLKESSELHDPPLKSAAPADLITSPLSFVKHAILALPSLNVVLAAFVPVFTMFGAFIKWNGGIVLGHKENHAVQLHVPQIYYFVTFAASFCWPTILSIARARGAVRTLLGSPFRLTATLATLALLLFTISRFTIIHPFLLADNRHYSFYLNKRLLSRTPWSKYVFAPGYLLAGTLLYISLADSGVTVLQLLMLLVCIAATIVPTPLIEPRYFITPYVLTRLHLRPPSQGARSNLATEAAFGLGVHIVTTGYFLRRTWSSWEGTGRLMW